MSTSMLVKCVVMIGILMICSYFDLKEKKIPVIAVLLGIIAITVINVIGQDISLPACLIGTVFGGLLLLISRLTKNALGMGDALLVLMIGAGMGIYQTALVLFYGLLVTAVVSTILLCMKRVKRNTEIPFVPFLLIGYVGVILSWQI